MWHIMCIETSTNLCRRLWRWAPIEFYEKHSVGCIQLIHSIVCIQLFVFSLVHSVGRIQFSLFRWVHSVGCNQFVAICWVHSVGCIRLGVFSYVNSVVCFHLSAFSWAHLVVCIQLGAKLGKLSSGWYIHLFACCVHLVLVYSVGWIQLGVLSWLRSDRCI